MPQVKEFKSGQRVLVHAETVLDAQTMSISKFEGIVERVSTEVGSWMRWVTVYDPKAGHSKIVRDFQCEVIDGQD